MTFLPSVVQIVLGVLVVVAGVYDIRTRRIPNWLVLLGLLVGIGLNGVLFEGAGLRSAGLGAGVAFLVYFPLYLIRGVGAGDAKLMVALGAIVGPWNWLGIWVLTVFLGGAVALFAVLAKGRLRRTLSNMVHILREIAHLRAPYKSRPELDLKSPRAATLPHAAMVALGALGYLLAAAAWAPR